MATPYKLPAVLLALVLALATGCIEPSEPAPPGTDVVSSELSIIDCAERMDTGYKDGKPFPIAVVTVDGKKVEGATANAYYVMAQAAAAKGINIKVNSGFRTMAEQERLYDCYVKCNCNNCNLAARPGYSNHQSGHALDLNTSAAGVLDWLNANGAAFGWKRTVPSEAWHWEWWGGGPGGGPCTSMRTFQASAGAHSYPSVMTSGERAVAWLELVNDGNYLWSIDKTLIGAQDPQDRSSPFFVAGNWLSASRPTGADHSGYGPGATGRFTFEILAPDVAVETDFQEVFQLVEDGMTWFGPKVTMSIRVVPAAGGTSDGGASDGGPEVAGTNPMDGAAGETAADAGGPTGAERTDGGGQPHPPEAADGSTADGGGSGSDGGGPRPIDGDDDSGCGCSVRAPATGRGPAPWVALAWAPLMAGAAVRRRRARAKLPA